MAVSGLRCASLVMSLARLAENPLINSYLETRDSGQTSKSTRYSYKMLQSKRVHVHCCYGSWSSKTIIGMFCWDLIPK